MTAGLAAPGLRREQDTLGDDRSSRGEEIMASFQEFQCEICGIVSGKPVHWFVIQCSNSQLTVLKWETEAANAKGARHYCGEAHAQVYISRWLEAACAPPRPKAVSHALVED